MNKKLNLYDNDTVKWNHDGKLYCLHIQRDETPESPREWDNITTMACWHRRYNLGDKIDDKELEDFWRRLVRENVPESEIFAMAEAGQLKGIRITKNEEDPKLVDVYETYYWQTVLGKSEPKECLEYEGVDKDTAIYYLLDDLTIQHCMALMEPYAEWLPLWLYDHSGITMSCGARTYPYNDRWDSGQVGWIVALKETIMAETSEFVLDENGNRIREEHQHEGRPSTWSYKIRPLTDETWRKRAINGYMFREAPGTSIDSLMHQAETYIVLNPAYEKIFFSSDWIYETVNAEEPNIIVDAENQIVTFAVQNFIDEFDFWPVMRTLHEAII